ncbi:MAG: hypothetical protein WCD81_05055 [Candidatus Bathyarchaeia archaeon]
MPSISIDTFFACTFMVSVVIIATVSVTGTMVTRIDSWKNLNEESYLKAIADSILSSAGTPSNWGSDPNVKPEEFGLAAENLASPGELDLDKVCRLNPQNDFALSYMDILNASRLTDLAMGISISQMMNIDVSLFSNSSQGDSTTYVFRISVSQDSGPTASTLHCYVVARDFLQDQYSNTSTDGTGYASFQVPNDSNGAAALVVFARADQDPMMTAYTVQLFAHLSDEPLPDNTFLDLSPLNNTLHLAMKFPNMTVGDGYAFSYAYQANLVEDSNTSCTIPGILDSSPIVLVVTGLNGSDFFAEWTAYPQIPFQTGADFNDSESHAFSYLVIIRDTLYKLTLSFGGVNP